MSNDLISRSALLTEVEGAFNRHYEQSSYQFIHDFFRCAVKRIKNAPAVDAVEVVRCKDCKRVKQGRFDIFKWVYCSHWHTEIQKDNFCCFGERRVDDGK